MLAANPKQEFDLREEDGCTAGKVTAGMALAMAKAGMIEGVCNRRTGKVNYLRYLGTGARPFGGVALNECLSLTDLEEGTGRSTAIASTGLGVYRQALSQAVVIDGQVTDGGVAGYCWAFAMLRRAGV